MISPGLRGRSRLTRPPTDGDAVRAVALLAFSLLILPPVPAAAAVIAGDSTRVAAPEPRLSIDEGTAGAEPSRSEPSPTRAEGDRGAPRDTTARSAPVTTSRPPSCGLVSAGNLDGEGDDEIVCWNIGRISIWQRAAAEWREVYPASGGAEDAVPLGMPSRLLVADIDGDGRDDALFGFGAAKGSGSAPVELVAVRVKGQGAARRRVTTTLYRAQPQRPEVTGLEAADLDGDGRPEILLAHFDDRYQVAVSVLSRLPGADPLGGLLPVRSLGRIRMATAWAAGRLAGERSPAIAVGRAYGDERSDPGDLFLLKGEERIHVPTQLGVHSVAIGDGDGDGTTEIYFGDGWHREYAAKARGRLSVARRRADGSWASELIEDTAGQYEIRKIVIGDVDGDGKPEILTAGNIYVSLFWRSKDGWMMRRLADADDFAVARLGGQRVLVLPGRPIVLLPLKGAKSGGAPVSPPPPARETSPSAPLSPAPAPSP